MVWLWHVVVTTCWKFERLHPGMWVKEKPARSYQCTLYFLFAGLSGLWTASKTRTSIPVNNMSCKTVKSKPLNTEEMQWRKHNIISQVKEKKTSGGSFQGQYGCNVSVTSCFLMGSCEAWFWLYCLLPVLVIAEARKEPKWSWRGIREQQLPKLGHLSMLQHATNHTFLAVKYASGLHCNSL